MRERVVSGLDLHSFHSWLVRSSCCVISHGSPNPERLHFISAERSPENGEPDAIGSWPLPLCRRLFSIWSRLWTIPVALGASRTEHIFDQSSSHEHAHADPAGSSRMTDDSDWRRVPHTSLHAPAPIPTLRGRFGEHRPTAVALILCDKVNPGQSP